MNGGTEGRMWRAGIPSSASVYLRLLFLIRFSARHKPGKQEQRWSPARPQCPHEALLVCSRIKSFYLLAFVCVFNVVWFRPVISNNCDSDRRQNRHCHQRANGHLESYISESCQSICLAQIKRLLSFRGVLIMLCFISVSFF